MAVLEATVLERATPGSRIYQQWLGYDEITEIVRNDEGFESVSDWLAKEGVTVSWVSRRRDYIKATAPIGKWEELLNTNFYEYEDESIKPSERMMQTGVNRHGEKRKGKVIHRAEEYFIPTELKDHVFAVFNTVQTPPPYKAKYRVRESAKHGTPFKSNLRIGAPVQSRASSGAAPQTTYDGTVTVSFLNSYYEIPSNIGSASLSQSVFETSTEYFSTQDLTSFQQTYGLTVQSAQQIGGHQLTTCPTNSNTEDCYEGNLDIQYIMGVAQMTTSIYWWVTDSSSTDPFLAWITAVADETNPPKSNSMSWGSVEELESAATMTSFNNEAIILGGMGVTVTVSSGDDGAPNEYNSCLCDYNSGSSTTSWTVCRINRNNSTLL